MDNQPSDAAKAEYAAVVAGIQSQNIEITPEMQRLADQIRATAKDANRAREIKPSEILARQQAAKKTLAESGVRLADINE
jgi:hypothetical protein